MDGEAFVVILEQQTPDLFQPQLAPRSSPVQHEATGQV